MTWRPGNGDTLSGTPDFKAHRQGMAAVALRLAGATYAEIADALGFSGSDTARIAVESELAQMAVNADLDMLRVEEAARLERLLRSVWQKATTPDNPEHLVAVKVALAVIDRHSRLLGLDAPTQVAIHTPTQHEIEAWVAGVTAAANEEYLILEAEVVETAALDPG